MHSCKRDKETLRFMKCVTFFEMVDLSDLQKGARFMEFHKFKELMYFAVQKVHMCTDQLLGMYPSRKNK